MQRARSLDPGPIGLTVLGLAAAAMVLSSTLVPRGIEARAVWSASWGAGAMFLAGGLVLRAARRPGAWRATAGCGSVLLAIGAVRTLTLVGVLMHPPTHPYGGGLLVDTAFVVLGVLVLRLFRVELSDHFAPADRREVLADLALIAVAGTAIVFVSIRPAVGSSASATVTLAVFSAVVMTGVTAWGALALWVPSPVHLGLFAAMSSFGTAGLVFGYQWAREAYVGGQAAVDLPLGLGALGLAALLTMEPHFSPETPEVAGRWGRPVVTAAAVGAACTALMTVSVMEFDRRAGVVEGSVLVGLLGVAVTARIVMNQLAGRRAEADVARALTDKEEALADKDLALANADAALIQLMEFHDSLAESEARLRLLVDAAADGIVELDGDGVIRRANEAFCAMMELPPDEAIGRTWDELCARSAFHAALGELPVTGHATLARDGQDLHVEARSSELPGPKPGRLLVIRDVTAARVADQTIRSLFKFLQDRDEDRTRLLKRTNSAIEAERNRIARDLHDGPVQGVSAATLSLEAVLLLLGSGSPDKAASMLRKIRQELAEETENLRRLMSDLRPPVLDERGLVPALREMLARFGRDSAVRTTLSGRSVVDVPPDLETLAYRIVQEALTNAGKHARATEVGVSVEAVAGELRIEVVDDGVGFNTGSTREYLRAGRVGLASMRERTELAGGELMVRSSSGGGTVIVATLPLEVTSARAPALA